MKSYQRNILSQIKTSVFILLLSTSFLACNKEKGVLPTISQIAVGLADLSQLENSAIKADLVIALSNKNPTAGSNGNYTVFAPTNQAFEKIGLTSAQDLNLLQKSFLADILKYHVANGTHKNDDLSTGSFPSLIGENVPRRIIVRNQQKYINGSKIIVTNATADNGVVHVIDRVLLGSGTDIANTAIFFAQGRGFIKPELTFLVEALTYCNLVNTLSNKSANYTVFAPTDQAFKNLSSVLGITINQPSDVRKIDQSLLTQVLLNHVINAPNQFTSELYPGNRTALSGKNILIGDYINGLETIKGAGNIIPANMVIPDIQTTNGVVHVIDRVLLP
ncbi:MAG TPA: fasciclin domain-containing protein [Pelobium sp.]